MIFQSILFQTADNPVPTEQPDFFADLNLDQIVAAITVGKDEYDLKPFFYASLHDTDAITYRHEVMQALERSRLFDVVKDFARQMQAMRQHLVQADKLYERRQKQRWFLEAVEIYCDAVTRLVHELSNEEFTSRGLLAFRDFVTRYALSERFTAVQKQTKDLLTDLASVNYNVLIHGAYLEVRKYDGESDYSVDVQATFERFKQGDVKSYKFTFIDEPGMNPIEAKVLDLVSLLYPDIFTALENFNAANEAYCDPTIVAFDREIQFYVACLDYIGRFRAVGLAFCYPVVTDADKDVRSGQSFDLALAGKLLGDRAVPICNDFHLENRERIIVVSGPNQGGKTTFARAFGQLHHLASLGCTVPGREAQLFLFDHIFTHFEREENIQNLRGKLQDDLVRVHQILARATPNSIIIMNEIFTSTALEDAVLLSKKIAAKIMELDLLCVWVTFLDELASLGEQTVSMVSTVIPDSPAERTFRIDRRPADGLSYAMSIAERHRLTYDMIKERIGS